MIMKRILKGLTIIGILISLWGGMAPQRSYAQTTSTGPQPAAIAQLTPTPTTLLSGSDVIHFANLGLAPFHLRGPIDSTRIVFGLPAPWELTEDGQVQLSFSTFFGGVGVLPTTSTPQLLGGSLTVEFNEMVLETILLDQGGDRIVTIPIPATALVATRSDGRHVLVLTLDSGLSCDFDQQTTVVIHPTSRLSLPHRLTRPLTDLARLPRPIYQNSFVPDEAMLVVPDQPTASDLQAALAVAAGFGQMSDSALNLSLTPVGQLTPTARNNQHLIFVGPPTAFAMLKDVPLPAPVQGTRFSALDATPDDGIVQIAVSPWNTSRVVLVVGGNSEKAVVKAGQAVSSGVIQTGDQPNLALVAEVPLTALPNTVAPDRTFADLGYEIVTLEGRYAAAMDYRFYVPSGQVVSDNAYLDLVFAHSAQLIYERSGAMVILNDQAIGSVYFSQDSTQVSQARITIPPSAVRSGINRLVIQPDLVPRATCLDTDQTDVWLTLRPESLLHLPLGPAEGSLPVTFDLRKYPAPFTTDPSLNNLAFVLARDDPNGWNLAARIAFDLGDRARLTLAKLVATYADSVSEDIRANYDLIVVGRPSTLPLIAELGSALPAPFAAGSDLATEQDLSVVYRLPADASVGYLELLSAPWQGDRAVLAVLGNTDQGVQWAGNALVNPTLRGRLTGNFAVVNAEQVLVGETQVSRSVSNLVTTAVPGSVAQPVTISSTAIVQRPTWILPVLGLSLTLMLIVIGFVGASLRRQRSSIR
jgi:hypothetical protein